MLFVILYLSTAIVFLAADVVGLRLVVKPVFDRHVAHLFARPFRMGPATVFYLGYIVGILWLVSVPAMLNADPAAALIGGMVLGLMAYGTYEFTNYATLQDWRMEQVIVDTIWGALLTGFAAWAGVMITGTVL